MQFYRGVNYYQEYKMAKVIRDRLPAGARIVDFSRGWAIQYFISGPYYPEHGLLVDRENRFTPASYPA